MADDVDLTAPLPQGLTLIEASAGTGKTYTLMALALRSLAEDDVPVSSLCLMTFTEAATTEMRGRLRSTLAKALAHLTSDDVAHEDAVIDLLGRDVARRAVFAARLERALADLDMAWVTTLHGWCARVLAMAGWWGGSSLLAQRRDDVDEVVHDVIIARYAQSGDLPAPLTRLAEAVRTRLAMPLADLQELRSEPPEEGVTAAVRQRWATAIERTRRCGEVVEVVEDIVAEVQRRRRQQRRQSFDGLLTDTREVLLDPRRVDVVRTVRERFAVVLVDEFQDTDQVQWDIVRRAFLEPLPGVAGAPDEVWPRRVVLVGDPKQSIYRFRSAELSAYLAARRHAEGRVQTLRVNWRSDPALLAGLEHLLDGVTFGDDEVRFQAVQAPDGIPAVRLHGLDAAPLQLRVVAGVPTASASLRRAVRSDVTATAGALLQGALTVDDPRHPEGRRPLRPADIAVLTRSNDDASQLALDLSAAGIPAATASTSSVLDSDAAHQWRVLLAALVQPSRTAPARAAATGWFLGLTLDRLAGDVVTTVEGLEMSEQLQAWSEQVQRGGVPALMSAMSAAGWHQRLLGRVDGERHVTDVDHIAELLHTTTGGHPIHPAAALDLLDDLAAAADERSTAELLARRLDRDDDAVQVMTIHKAKGLEFPVVLCPALWTGTAGRRGPAHAAVDGRRRIDLTSMFDLTEAMKRLVSPVDLHERDKAERLGEERRLLYVALTRARHHCVVWWADPDRTSSEFRTIVGDRGGPHALATASGGTVHSVDVTPTGAVARPPAPPVRDDASLDVATASRTLDRRWRIWSFSAITAQVDDTTSAPTGGGMDEVGTGHPSHDHDGEPADHAVSTALRTAPGGTRFGTVVHRILERCDFAHPSLLAHLTEVCGDELARSPLAVTAEELADGLATVLDVPLGGPAGVGPLRGLARHDRLDELDFHLPLGVATVRHLAEVLLDHLPPDDPARRWAHDVATGALDVHVEGRLTGSIDLVARTGRHGRVWLADYKTNRLGPTQGADPDELHHLMTHSHYWLQAALYLVAVHRYLRWRQPGYDPDDHLVGAAYLFVRGMHPGRPGNGVVWWRPPTVALEALDRWIAGSVTS